MLGNALVLERGVLPVGCAVLQQGSGGRPREQRATGSDFLALLGLSFLFWSWPARRSPRVYPSRCRRQLQPGDRYFVLSWLAGAVGGWVGRERRAAVSPTCPAVLAYFLGQGRAGGCG